MGGKRRERNIPRQKNGVWQKTRSWFHKDNKNRSKEKANLCFWSDLCTWMHASARTELCVETGGLGKQIAFAMGHSSQTHPRWLTKPAAEQPGISLCPRTGTHTHRLACSQVGVSLTPTCQYPPLSGVSAPSPCAKGSRPIERRHDGRGQHSSLPVYGQL